MVINSEQKSVYSWRRWFAWRPVRLTDDPDKIVWLQMIETRDWLEGCAMEPEHHVEYRLINTPSSAQKEIRS